MIYVFYGEDTFSVEEALQGVLEAAGLGDARESNLSQLDASDFTTERFGAAAMVMPFLADRRVVVVRGLMGAAEGQRTGRRGRRAAANDGGPAAGLPELLAQLPPTTDAVFIDGKLQSSNPLLEAVRGLGKEQATVREFQPLKREALDGWIRDRAKRKGAAIEPRAAAVLADQIGANLWALDMEMEKLAIYANGRPITEDDVRALVASTRETTVFEVIDAIMDRRPDAALKHMERMREEGSSGPGVLVMMARQARMLALAHELTRRKAPRDEWGKVLGTTSDFLVRKTADQARRISPAAVRGLYRLLLETDLAMKTGEASEELALTELIARASALAGPARVR